jgi:hypothetical protein
MRDLLHIFCDHMATIADTKELGAHSAVKHILRRYHVIREYVKDGKVKVCKVYTDLNVADPLMRPLPWAKFNPHLDSMGVRSLPTIN